ncbi:MAG: type II toxin-antitoxin system VapC family toxin [Gammaproteobacteria bacterium]|nr:type II toxin-antitoxin system VapC family toxin [Gammaproteobacteria bacterium]
MRFGAERAGSESYHYRIDKVCERMDCVAEWTTECADKFAKTQSALFEKGVPIGFTDAMIASHALIIDATLVSNNEKHFSRVEGLRLENWLKVPTPPSSGA